MSKLTKIKEEIDSRYNFVCSCRNEEHQINFTIMRNPDETSELCVTYSLADNYPFFKRLTKAIKYIFGYRSKYGMFAETLLDVNDARKIVKICNQVIAANKDKNVINLR